MTRARNGTASAVPAGVWHDLPQPDDDEPDEPRGTGYRPPPTIIDGDEHYVRTTSGAVCLAVYSDRTGWRVSEDDPSYGTDDEPSGYSDHSITVAAVLIEAPRQTRHGKHATPAIKARPTPEEKTRWQALADEEGIPLSEWIVEACRAYECMAKRKDGVLTDSDWRSVVSG